MGPAYYHGNQTYICVHVFDSAMAAVAPADPGFSGPLCSLFFASFGSASCGWLNWFELVSLWVQTRSAAARDSEFSIKVVQMWEKYLKGTFPEVLIPVIEVPHLGVKYKCLQIDFNYNQLIYVKVYFCIWIHRLGLQLYTQVMEITSLK